MSEMKYQPVAQRSREELDAAFNSGDPGTIHDALICAAYVDMFHQQIAELVLEWRRLNRTIARLESQQQRLLIQAKPHSKRGRRSIPDEERAEISRRLKAYWARRRKQRPLG